MVCYIYKERLLNICDKTQVDEGLNSVDTESNFVSMLFKYTYMRERER